MKKLFSRGNHKLSKCVAIFNLPEIDTCPGSTSICRSTCYATKASRQYPKNVPPHRKACYEASQRDDFVTVAVSQLTSMKGLKYVRVHEAGDLYSQSYLNKWIEVAKALPELTFMAYTRSHSLDFSGLPENFRIIFSYDKENYTGVEVPFKRSYLQLKDEKAPFKGYICAAREGKKGYCGDTCLICWKGASDVIFPKH